MKKSMMDDKALAPRLPIDDLFLYVIFPQCTTRDLIRWMYVSKRWAAILPSQIASITSLTDLWEINRFVGLSHPPLPFVYRNGRILLQNMKIINLARISEADSMIFGRFDFGDKVESMDLSHITIHPTATIHCTPSNMKSFETYSVHGFDVSVIIAMSKNIEKLRIPLHSVEVGKLVQLKNLRILSVGLREEKAFDFLEILRGCPLLLSFSLLSNSKCRYNNLGADDFEQNMESVQNLCALSYNYNYLDGAPYEIAKRVIVRNTDRLFPETKGIHITSSRYHICRIDIGMGGICTNTPPFSIEGKLDNLWNALKK